MSEESILLIDQMEANGESPEAIAEVLRKKEEEEKKFDPVNDLMNKINNNKVVKQVVKPPLEGTSPLAEDVSYEYDPEPYYTVEKTDGTKEKVYDPKSHYIKNTVNKTTGETTKAVVNSKDVPTSFVKKVKKDIKSRIDKDINSVSAKEFMDLFQTDKDDVGKIEEQINKEVNDYLDIENMDMPTTPSSTVLPKNVMDAEGNIREYTATDSRNAYDQEITNYKKLREDNQNSVFASYLRKADEAFEQNFQSPSEEGRIEFAKELYLRDEKAKFIKHGLTQWIEDNIDWGDTFVSGAKTFRDFKWILDKANISALPEEQRIFLDKLKDYYDEIGYKTTVDGKRVEPPKIVKTKQTLQIQEDFINLNKEDLILKGDEIKAKELDWKNKLDNSNEELEKYKDIPSVLNDLEDLQNQMQSFSELTDEEGRLDEENYNKYKVIYDEYQLLLNENKGNITSYQNAVTNHNQLIEQYNTPYIDTDGKEWKNELEYDYSNYNSILDKTNTMVRSYQLLNDDLLDQIEDSGDLDIFINSLSRDHSEVAQFTTYLKTKAVDLAMGVESAAFHVTKAPRRLILEPIWNNFLVENGYIDENGNINEVTQAVFETMENASPLFGVIPVDRNEVRTAINNFQEQRLKGVQERTTWDDAKGGSLYDWGEYIVGASADFIPQLAALVTAPQVGLVALSSSAAGMKFEEMLEKNKHGGSYSMWDMYIASGVTFGSEYLTERFVTLPLIEAAGGKDILRNGFRAGMRNLLNPKNILTGVGGAALESGSEVLATMGENFGMKLAGDKISIYKGIDEAAFNGLLMERIIKAPRVFKQVVYPFLPKSELSKLTDSAKKIREIESQLKNPNLAPETRKILKERIARIVADNTKVLTKAIDRIDEMTPEQRRLVFDTDIKFVETLELIRNIKEDGSISTEAKQNLIKEITDEYYKLEKQKNDMLDEINMRQDEEVSKKTTEKLQERGVKTGFNIAQTPQEFYEIYVRETGDTQTPSHVIRSKDGFFTPGGMWVSNRTRAKETGAISVASHEVLHSITESTFNGDARIVKDKQGNDVEVTITEEGVKLIKDFLGKLSSKERAVLDKRMDSGTERYIRDKDKNIIGEKAFEQYAQEYLTYYSDAIRLKQINPKKDVLNRIKEPFINLFKLRGYDNIEFKDGNSVRNFIIDYAADVKAGEVRESILAIAGPGGAKIGELKFSETEINDQAVLEDVNTINARQAEMDRIAKERGVKPIKDQRSIRLEANVIDAIKTPVNKIAETLTKALYDPIAIDARGGISRSDYRASLKSELNNMVIQEYNGDQGVEKFIINRGWKRAQSLARRLGIESTKEYGGKGIMKRSDALDNAYEAGEDVGINFEAAREKVQSMLDTGQITQRRADDLLAQLKEIENDKAGQEVETGKTRRILDIKENSTLYNEILEEVRNILGPINFDEVLTNKKTEKKFRQALEKAFLKTEFAKKVKKLIGTQKSDKFKKLLETKQNEIQALVGVKYATRFKGENALVESLGRLGVQESAETQTSLEGSFVMNEKGGNETWALKEMTPQQFQDIFIKGRETQYKSLVNAIINELGLDAVFHPGILPEGATKESAKLTEAIKRNPSVRFSETIEPEIQALANTEVETISNDVMSVLRLALTHGYKTPSFYQALQDEGIDQSTIVYLDTQNFEEYFEADVSGFKKPLQNLLRKGEFNEDVTDMLDIYFADVMNKTSAEAKQQLVDSMMELIDALEPEVVAALKPQMFGLTGSDRLLGGKNFKFPELRKKYDEKIKQKSSGKNLDFDPAKTHPLNANQGLMLKIQNILAQPFKTWQAKKDEVRRKYGKQIDEANNNNPKLLKHLAKTAHNIFMNKPGGVGILRWYEAATSNVLAQRAYTALPIIQYHAKSQAPYVGKNKDGDIIKYYAKKPTKKTKGKDVVVVEVNKEHPDYSIAEAIARNRANKTAKKKGYNKAWIEQEVKLIVGEHLRFKGEHIDPSANVMREIALLSLKIKSGENLNFDTEYDIITANFNQSLGVEAYSRLQDIKLGTTSELGDMRILSIEKDANINSFKTSDNAAIQITGYIKRVYADISVIQSVKESMKDLMIPNEQRLIEAKIISNAVKKARTVSFSETPKGITVLDFDDTLATTESLVRFTAPDGTTGTLNAEEYAATYQDLLGKGYKFDFSEFNKVVKGKLAPLFNKALKLQKKFGPKNMFVLTARPPAAQKAIFDFLKANGLNIPLKNITGLGNSTSEAKALWIAEKVGEGYNDFYFADDALQNVQAVQNMLDQFDVKSKVQQAKVKFSETMDGEFNSILEETTGMQSEKEFSAAKAKLRGKGKGRFDFFIPPSAEDFKGLLYRFLAKGKKGDLQMDWFKKALLDPFARGYRELNEAKQRMWNDYNALRKAMPDVRKKLTKKIEGQKDFRYSDAVRVYLWDKAGFEIPGLSKSDKAMLLEVVNNDQRLKDYAGVLGLISKRPEGYVEPSREWLVGNIMSDLEGANKVNRAEFLAEWIENKDIIFSEKNLNKIEAIYGANFREALEDMLYRMEKGTNRITGSNRLVNAFQNWINNSVGAIMFFNARSAVLQTLSTVNFINWGDNNIAKAAMAFANQKQFWKDFTFLFNSDMLKQRRKGLKTDVNTAELTEAVGRSKNPVMAALNYLLQKGFLPTQIADSFAISSGGATFYRNRVNTYLKEGLSQKEAETKAFEDFQEIAEETQQSSRPDLISQQQASTLGRLILAFQNTPMQYMRLTKKAISDLVNGRGDAKTNISRILYYGAVQNVIFFSLQSALFALAFDDDEDDEKRAKTEEKKMQRLYHGILDSILRGTGVGGAVVSTIKNMIVKIGEEEGKGWNQDFDNVVIEGLQLSPPIGSKVRKLRGAGKSWSYNRDVIKKMDTFDLDNPVWDAVGNVVSALTNAPMDRIVNKTKNIREALNDDNATWQRIALMLGWNRWDLNVKSDKIELVKTIVKEEKKQKAKEKREEKKKEEEALKQLEIDNTIKEEIKEEKETEKKGEKKKEYTCANVNSKGKRCSIVVPKAGMRCTIHEKVEQRVDGKKSQCKKVKDDGKRCKMQTSNKSGLCYYHD